jgi:phage protein D
VHRPAATLTIDGAALTAPEAALVSLHVELTVGGAHDRVRAILGHASPAAATEPGAPIEVELGYDDALELVLTGQVTATERGPSWMVLEGLSATVALSTARIGRSYVSQTAADVVSDLLSSESVDAGEIDAALQLASYHVDESSTAWSHVQRLALLAGCEVASAPDGGLVLRPPKSGRADHVLRHGAELVAWALGTRDRDAPPAVAPFGAASEEGSERWHVLLKEPEGGAPSTATLVPAALRDRDGAQALADALGRAAERRSVGGTLELVGDPAIRAGDLVELTEMPHGEDGTYRVLAAAHMLDSAGFRTQLRVEGAA